MHKVSLIKCSSYKYDNILEAVIKSLDLLGGINRFIKKGDKVALKPNILMPCSPDKAATTHPVLVKAIADIVKSVGAEVTIVESPGGPYIKPNLKAAYNKCGFEKIAKESDIALNYDLSVKSVNNSEAVCLKSVEILKPLIDADFIINIPKLKSHGMMRYTGAVKNMYGSIAGGKKAEYHFRLADYNHFANAIIDIFQTTKPGLNIIDAIIGMDGNGPSSGNPINLNFIACSENAFALDYTCLNVINIKPETVRIIKSGIERGLCPESIDKIEVLGENIDDIKIKNFIMPEEDKLSSITFFKNNFLNKLINIAKPKPIFNKKLCIGCRICEKNCPAKIIEMKNNYPTFDINKCIRCFCCQELCPQKAVSIKKHSKPVQSFLNNILVILSIILPRNKK